MTSRVSKPRVSVIDCSDTGGNADAAGRRSRTFDDDDKPGDVGRSDDDSDDHN